MSVRVEGLPRLLSDLGRVDSSDGVRQLAGRSDPQVAQIIRARTSAGATTRQMSRSVRSNRYETGAAGVVEVIVGGEGGDREWAVGAQFGSARYRQFPGWRSDGYTVIPAAKEEADRIADVWAEATINHFP